MWSNSVESAELLITAGANIHVQDAQGIYLINNKQLKVILQIHSYSVEERI